MALDFAAIREAHERIRPHIHRTPVLTSGRLDALAGARLFFKCENFQKTGAFKARGATNAVLALPDAVARRGVATHSSGNHAAALARAARLRGIPSHIVMPANSSKVKVRAVEAYGGRIVFCEPTQAARESVCAELVVRTGATLIHPFENEHVVAGQGTAAVELLEEVPDLELILCPVGGGGLLAGTAIAATSISPRIAVVVVEPAEAADAVESFRAGSLRPRQATATIADGLRTNIGAANFLVMLRLVADAVPVSEPAIVAAMRTVWETMKIVIEPSAAVAYAAIADGTIALRGRRTGIILSGGNVDLDGLPWVAEARP
jgi:threonine dehydratase